MFRRTTLLSLLVAIAACGSDPDPQNFPPGIDDESITTAEDTPLELTLSSVDPEGDAIEITIVTEPEHGSLELVGMEATYFPDPDYSGPDEVTVSASDGVNEAVEATIDVTVTPVNDAPIGVADGFVTDEETPQVVTTPSLVANDIDVDDTILTVIEVSNPINGTVSLVGATITFLPEANFTGMGSYQYRLSDGEATATATVTIGVGNLQDPPVAVDDTAAATEDVPATIAAASLLANDSDPDGQTLTITAVGGAVQGSVGLSGTTITFTPAANHTGAASFQYTVSDGTASDIATVAVTVAAVDDPPFAGADDAAATEDTLLTIPMAALLADDGDIDGPGVAITGVSNSTGGTATINGTNVDFDPADDSTVTGGFDYTVTSGGLTATAHVTVTVAAVDDAPVAGDDERTTNEDVALNIVIADLLLDDSDIDGPGVTFTSITNVVNGSIGPIGASVTFTPAADYNGAAAGFDYTITSGGRTDVGHVTITVNALQDAPRAGDDTAFTPVDVPVDIDIVDLLANDVDVDGPGISFTSFGSPVNGTVARTNDTLTFTPTPAGFTGTGSFEYTITSGGLTDVGLVTVTVAAPVCGDGIVNGTDQCDDDNSNELDGCTSQCVDAVECNVTEFPGGTAFAVDPATGHCYVQRGSSDWVGGEAGCVNLGGYLAAITSAGEQAVVATFNAPYWIGGSRATELSPYAWVTGEAFVYTNFGTPPDLVGPSCLFAVPPGDAWDDVGCSAALASACELEVNPCGDGVLHAGMGEECDDSNNANGDSCSASCQFETGCGDGDVDAGEECDDDNRVDDDGCSATCQGEVVSIAIQPVPGQPLAVDQQQRIQLRAIGTMTFGSPEDLTAVAVWDSSDDLVATVGTAGLVGTLNVQNSATITAAFDGQVGAKVVTVGPAVCHITINEVQAAGATSADEWVEIHNGCTFGVDVTGWTLVYRAAATVGATDTNTLGTLTGTINPGAFRLHASGSASAPILAIADVTWGGGAGGFLAGTNGSVGLRSGLISVGPLVDAVAYGAVTAGHPFQEGGQSAPALATSRSVMRAPFDGRDTNVNGADFVLSPVGGPTTPKATNFP